jgi:hypothetical protein
MLLGLRGGTTVTGVVLRNLTAAVGTNPTTARFGIADNTGKVLAIGGNANAAAGWAAGALQFAFTAPYTTLADGGYFACFVVNGTWGSTQPALIRAQNNVAGPLAAIGSNTIPGFSWTGQTDLPAVSSSLTITTPLVQGFYMGFY